MNQETPSTSALIALLRKGPLNLPPVTLTMANDDERNRDERFDAIVDGTWQDGIATFAVECKRSGTPKEFAVVAMSNVAEAE